jgi:hypothetical protein
MIYITKMDHKISEENIENLPSVRKSVNEGDVIVNEGILSTGMKSAGPRTVR